MNLVVLICQFQRSKWNFFEIFRRVSVFLIIELAHVASIKPSQGTCSRATRSLNDSPASRNRIKLNVKQHPTQLKFVIVAPRQMNDGKFMKSTKSGWGHQTRLNLHILLSQLPEPTAKKKEKNVEARFRFDCRSLAPPVVDAMQSRFFYSANFHLHRSE